MDNENTALQLPQETGEELVKSLRSDAEFLRLTSYGSRMAWYSTPKTFLQFWRGEESLGLPAELLEFIRAIPTNGVIISDAVKALRLCFQEPSPDSFTLKQSLPARAMNICGFGVECPQDEGVLIKDDYGDTALLRSLNTLRLFDIAVWAHEDIEVSPDSSVFYDSPAKSAYPTTELDRRYRISLCNWVPHFLKTHSTFRDSRLPCQTGTQETNIVQGMIKSMTRSWSDRTIATLQFKLIHLALALRALAAQPLPNEKIHSRLIDRLLVSWFSLTLLLS